MPDDFFKSKIALVHDWLLEVGGAERVLRAIHGMFPEAPIFVFFRDKKFTDGFLPDADIRVSKYQKFYNKLFGRRLMTPILPLAIESLDLSDFDVVISTAPFAKGLILNTNVVHIDYCHSPTRQFWDWQSEYLRENHRTSKKILALFQHFLRIWDRSASTRVDSYVANSFNTQRRIKKYYGRDSVVIHPPVDVKSTNSSKTKNYFLIVSRLFPHKNINIAVKAFSRLDLPLVIIGSGPEMRYLKKLAGKNIKFLGRQPDAIVKKHMSECLAFILPQEEDFGIAPVEAMAFGKPVLALKRGGALEYIKEGINGEFFEDPREEMLADGVRRLLAGIGKYDAEEIKKTAGQFSRERFEKEIKEFILEKISTSQVFPCKSSKGPALLLATSQHRITHTKTPLS